MQIDLYTITWNEQRLLPFFFDYYEGFRQTSQPSRNLTIPANPDFFDGVFRYVSPGETAVKSVNVMQLSGQTVDAKLRSEFLSKVPASSNVNNYDAYGRAYFLEARYVFNRD